MHRSNMPKFQYTAVNATGSTLHGVVEANDIRAAKSELNRLDLQVVDLVEVDLKTKLLKSSLNKFKFEAVNQEGKVVKGTISALDENKAMIRLESEYNLQVSKIAHINATNKSFENSKSKIEGNDLVEKKIDESRVKALRNILIPLIDDLKSLMKHVKDVLGDQVGPATLEFIDKYYLHLDKIKFSENLNNIQSVCLKICTVLEKSEIFIENGDKVDEKLRVNLMARDLEKKFKNYDLPPSKRRDVLADVRVDSIWNLIAIIFSSKSSNQRKYAAQDLWKRFRGLFNFNENRFSDLVQIINEISFVLLILYSGYFLIGHFLTVKSTTFAIPTVLEVYSTNVLVYIVVGVLLLNTYVSLSQILKNRLMNLALGGIFFMLFTLFCINL